MKLRIRGNSIRLRVTQTELDRIAAGETVAETTDFGGGRRLTYRLAPDPDVRTLRAGFADGLITVALPPHDVEAWTTTDLVSLAGGQPTEDGGTLGILVEKDFHCLAPREGEDESDMFPHPETGTARC